MLGAIWYIHRKFGAQPCVAGIISRESRLR